MDIFDEGDWFFYIRPNGKILRARIEGWRLELDSPNNEVVYNMVGKDGLMEEVPGCRIYASMGAAIKHRDNVWFGSTEAEEEKPGLLASFLFFTMALISAATAFTGFACIIIQNAMGYGFGLLALSILAHTVILYMSGRHNF